MEIKNTYPLTWPVGWNRTKSPQHSLFGYKGTKPSIDKAVRFVLHEIELLTGDANSVVVSTNLKYRKDGLPYSDQREPDDNGAAIYFNHNKKQMVIACDNYNRIGCNIYGIGKTIEAMRAIKRYGASDLLNRAFEGFKVLQAPVPKRPWWEVLGIPKDCDYDAQTIKAAFKQQVLKVHPDVGGSDELMHELNEARELAEQTL